MKLKSYEIVSLFLLADSLIAYFSTHDVELVGVGLVITLIVFLAVKKTFG